MAALAAPGADAVIPPPHTERPPQLELDARAGRVAPSAAQRERVRALGAKVRWNRFGTPASLFRVRGVLARELPADPAAAARQFLRANRKLFRLRSRDVDRLQLIGRNPIGQGWAVLLRQRFGSLAAGSDGLVALAVKEGRVLYVTSSLAGPSVAPRRPAITATGAWLRAAAALGLRLTAADLSDPERAHGWTSFRTSGLPDLQRARLVAVPTYRGRARAAYETIVLDARRPLAATTFVDARTGRLLLRHDRVNYAGEPAWQVFPAYPPLDYSSLDTRERWCWTAGEECERILSVGAPRGGGEAEWDRVIADVPFLAQATPSTNTTLGNNADNAQAWLSPFTPAERYRPLQPSRDYTFPWTNSWYESKCDPSVLTPGGNDVDAAAANLFAMHNRMHDWSYHLGFTEKTWNLQYHNFGQAPVDGREGDPETGDVQAGGLHAGPTSALARDNANQITLNDGLPGVTNMYLWQSLPNAAYLECVDGDFDMAVIGHEYTHAISNRMVGGPDAGLSSPQGGAMGESWSDLVAAEYLNEYGLVPVADENPYAVGAYVTTDKQTGVRNYPMNDSPLNYSDIRYDFGSQVHADGEIWSATHFDIRQAMLERYGSGDRQTQEHCANGDLPAQACPGNRRWMQLVFDAWLLMQSGVDMIDARNAMLVADQLRFGGANQDLLWNAFARRGLGQHAASRGGSDDDPEPDFTSPFSGEAQVTFAPVPALEGGPEPKDVEIFVGDYEARATPIADTAETEPEETFPKDATAEFVPGTYRFVARADGFGHVRFTRTLQAGEMITLPVPMAENVASKSRGATASGDGSAHENLIDDTEATNWSSTGSPPVEGREVIVDLAGESPQPVRAVRVSSMLIGGGSRFAALRSFEILACTKSGGASCGRAEQFTSLYRSPPDAIPGAGWRPRAPQLIIRSFDVPDTTATHVLLRVLTNQCTGNSRYQGDQDNDPANDTDCVASRSNAALLPPQGGNVVAAELQVIGVDEPAGQPQADAVAPRVQVRVRPTWVARIARKGLQAMVISDEPITGTLVLTRQAARRGRAIGRADVDMPAGRQRVVLRPTRRGRQALRRDRARLLVVLRARDAAGNVSLATARVRLRR